MLSMSMVTSLGQLEVFMNSIKEVQLTVEELQTYLEMPELSEPEKPADLRDCSVELKKVHFSYSEDSGEVLRGIDLSCLQEALQALVGPSGGGKSTVARLIARFWDVTEGEILVGGVKITDMPLSQLSDTVSFVTQDNFLFRCSLKEISVWEILPQVTQRYMLLPRRHSAMNLSGSFPRDMTRRQAKQENGCPEERSSESQLPG